MPDVAVTPLGKLALVLAPGFSDEKIGRFDVFAQLERMELAVLDV